ncbi:MAG: hypothetical protein JJU20_15060 [Opitutales bacterium]|nr:hypothetical protein [Opitutales bacterium]
MNNQAAEIKILINYWTFWDQKGPDGKELDIPEMIVRTAAQGFDAFTCPSDFPNLKELLSQHELRFAAAFQAFDRAQLKREIEKGAEIDSGPMNCQLGRHNTSTQEAVSLTLEMMSLAADNGVDVHLETHRDTCTETPEKTAAIIETCFNESGKFPLVNFDFSHFSCVKHLDAGNYSERLLEPNKSLFQHSSLWHMRPFNGHHCQVPVTDGRGNLSSEYLEIRPFIKDCIQAWTCGPRPNNELWVCPELGPIPGYGLSCFPDRWADTIILANDLKKIWSETIK